MTFGRTERSEVGTIYGRIVRQSVSNSAEHTTTKPPIDWSLHQHRHGVRVPSVKRRRQIAKGALRPRRPRQAAALAWWLWAITCVGFIVYDRLGWALATGVMALLSYLTTPAAAPPRYGLSHEFDVESEEFLATIAGASGAPFVDGNAIEILNNGDAFYPRMLDAIAGAGSRSRSRPTSTGRARGR